MVTSRFATPATANVAGAAARSLLDSSECTFVRVWLTDGFGSAEPVTTAGGRPEGDRKFDASAAAAAIARGSRSLESLDSPANAAGGGVRLCIPLHTGDVPFGLVEAYASGAFDFVAAASAEAAVADLAARIAASATATVDGTSRGTIFVADDDPGASRLIADILTRSGFSVVLAHDGPSALARIGSVLPDLVLLDAAMPGIDGLEIARRMRADEQMKTIPVIILSDRFDPPTRAEASSAGVQDFITKPFAAGDLVSRVAHFSRWRKLLNRDEAAQPTAPGGRKRKYSPTESLAMYESRHGNLTGSLKLFVTEAETCEGAQRFALAARAYRGAAVVAQQMRADDLSNKYTRLAGKMYLSLAETTTKPDDVEKAYVNAAKCFLEAGNPELVAKSIALAASFESLTDNDVQGSGNRP